MPLFSRKPSPDERKEIVAYLETVLSIAARQGVVGREYDRSRQPEQGMTTEQFKQRRLAVLHKALEATQLAQREHEAVNPISSAVRHWQAYREMYERGVVYLKSELDAFEGRARISDDELMRLEVFMGQQLAVAARETTSLGKYARLSQPDAIRLMSIASGPEPR